VDLFYRCKKTKSTLLKFEQFSAYLIEHEIDVGKSKPKQADMRYVECLDITDKTQHNNNIEKIFYFQHIDKVVLYEQGMIFVRIYSAKTMVEDYAIKCSGVILAIEYLQNKNAIAVSLSDRTIKFFDATAAKTKIIRWLHVPSTQKCLTYVEDKGVLFSAGVDGAIFAWNMNKLFSNEFTEQLAARS